MIVSGQNSTMNSDNWGTLNFFETPLFSHRINLPEFRFEISVFRPFASAFWSLESRFFSLDSCKVGLLGFFTILHYVRICVRIVRVYKLCFLASILVATRAFFMWGLIVFSSFSFSCLCVLSVPTLVNMNGLSQQLDESVRSSAICWGKRGPVV